MKRLRMIGLALAAAVCAAVAPQAAIKASAVAARRS